MRAIHQNLNNPGKVIVISDRDDLPYGPEVTDIMVVADSANNRYVIVDLNKMECLEVIGNGKIGYKDGDFSEAMFHHT